MPQLTLTDGELLKKTLRTTLVMLGSTAVWLGALTGAVLMTTTPSSSSAADLKVEKASSIPTAPVGPGGMKSSPGMPGQRSVHRPVIGQPKTEAPHAGDPI